MKRCLCCNTEVDASAKTCPECGEASWGPEAKTTVKPMEWAADKAPAPQPKQPYQHPLLRATELTRGNQPANEPKRPTARKKKRSRKSNA